MSRSIGEKPTHSTSTLKGLIGVEMQKGITLSADPLNANLPDLSPRMTTIHSAWFGQICRVCKDKFREGDQVLLCPKCSEPFHNDSRYNLNCWQKKFSTGAKCKEGAVDDRFDQGGSDVERCDFSLSSAYSAASNILPSAPVAMDGLVEMKPLQRSPDALLVKQFVGGIETMWRPFGELENIKITSEMALAGRKCPWCRFYIRVGDWVVQCPCQSNCGTFFHQDIFHHLTCWNGWNGVEGNDFCPNTGVEYPESVKNKKRE